METLTRARGDSWVPAEPRTEQPHNRISHQPTAHQKAKCLEVKKKIKKKDRVA